MFWCSSYLIESSPPSVDDGDDWEKSKKSYPLNHRILSLNCFDHLPVTVTHLVTCSWISKSPVWIGSETSPAPGSACLGTVVVWSSPASSPRCATAPSPRNISFHWAQSTEHRVASWLVMKASSWFIVRYCVIGQAGPFPPQYELWTGSSISYSWLTFRRNHPYSNLIPM